MALRWDGGSLDYAGLVRRADLVSGALARRGVRPGDRVAVVRPNDWTFVAAVLGGLAIEATVAPIDPRLTGDERRVILDDLQPSVVLDERSVLGPGVVTATERAPDRDPSGLPGHAPMVPGTGSGVAGLASMVAGSASPVIPGDVPGSSDRSLISGRRASPAPESLPVAGAMDRITTEAPGAAGTGSGAPALVLYTSGSTGRPKGALLSHAAVAAAIASWAGPVMALTPEDVVLAALPLSHSYGLNGALLAPLLAGAAVLLVERFEPGPAAAAIREHGVTVFPGVATMFRRMLDTGVTREDLASVRLALSGAAPCPWDLACAWRERTGVRICRGYGMTELFRPISYLAGDPVDLPEAIGRPVPGVEVRIVDEQGDEVAPGAVGELLIRSPAAMDGYLGAPAETRAVLVDGWFHTGDLASRGPGGHVRIEGRKRERILRGGYSVFPGEVEAVLRAHAAVAEAAVVGRPHAELGEEVVAYVELDAGVRAEPAELIAHCRERLAGYKYPRAVVVVDRLPRSATGKVLKSRLT